jgi:hypothetical protein
VLQKGMSFGDKFFETLHLSSTISPMKRQIHPYSVAASLLFTNQFFICKDIEDIAGLRAHWLFLNIKLALLNQAYPFHH